MKLKNGKKVVVIFGVGTLGMTIVNSLKGTTITVRVIEIQSQLLNNCSDVRDVQTVSEINPKILETLGLKDPSTTIIITFGSHLEDKMTIITWVKNNWTEDKVAENLVVRAENENEFYILENLGVKVICPKRAFGRLLAKSLIWGGTHVEDTGDGFYVAEHIVFDRIIGKTLPSSIPKGILILKIKRNDKVFMPGPETEFEEGDIITFFGNEDNINKFLSNIP